MALPDSAYRLRQRPGTTLSCNKRRCKILKRNDEGMLKKKGRSVGVAGAAETGVESVRHHPVGIVPARGSKRWPSRRKSRHHATHGTRRSPVLLGSVTASFGYLPYQSETHSHAFPAMSHRPTDCRRRVTCCTPSQYCQFRSRRIPACRCLATIDAIYAIHDGQRARRVFITPRELPSVIAAGRKLPFSLGRKSLSTRRRNPMPA